MESEEEIEADSTAHETKEQGLVPEEEFIGGIVLQTPSPFILLEVLPLSRQRISFTKVESSVILLTIRFNQCFRNRRTPRIDRMMLKLVSLKQGRPRCYKVTHCIRMHFSQY